MILRQLTLEELSLCVRSASKPSVCVRSKGSLFRILLILWIRGQILLEFLLTTSSGYKRLCIKCKAAGTVKTQPKKATLFKVALVLLQGEAPTFQTEISVVWQLNGGENSLGKGSSFSPDGSQERLMGLPLLRPGSVVSPVPLKDCCHPLMAV